MEVIDDELNNHNIRYQTEARKGRRHMITRGWQKLKRISQMKETWNES